MVKSKLPPQSGSSLEAVEPHPKKGAIKFFFSQNSLFKHFHRYLSIFRDIDGYLATLIGAHLGKREEASQPKKYPNFGKKGPDYVHFSVTFSI